MSLRVLYLLNVILYVCTSLWHAGILLDINIATVPACGLPRHYREVGLEAEGRAGGRDGGRRSRWSPVVTRVSVSLVDPWIG